MSKKPASLTSDLLARKGEAQPSSADPISRVTLSGGRQPGLSGIGETEGPSHGLYASPVLERPDMQGMDEEERPRPPEPEIIYTPEDYDGSSRTRLIVGAFVGLAMLGGVIVAFSLNDNGGVAPVSPDVAQAPGTVAPGTVAPTTPAPAAPASDEALVPGADVAEGPAALAPDIAPDLRPGTADRAETPAPVESKAAESQPVETPPAPVAEATPAPAAPVSAAKEPAAAPETAAPVAPATPVTAASGGTHVVQLLAVREEAAARTAWAAVQKKHSAILGGHALDIERADLGDKGIFYRVRAAGFDSKAAATTACGKLKAAGQDCLVKTR